MSNSKRVRGPEKRICEPCSEGQASDRAGSPRGLWSGHRSLGLVRPDPGGHSEVSQCTQSQHRPWPGCGGWKSGGGGPIDRGLEAEVQCPGFSPRASAFVGHTCLSAIKTRTVAKTLIMESLLFWIRIGGRDWCKWQMSSNTWHEDRRMRGAGRLVFRCRRSKGRERITLGSCSSLNSYSFRR